MSRDPRLFLEDIRESCAKIRRYTQGMTFEEFLRDEKTLDAVIRNLTIIGEARTWTVFSGSWMPCVGLWGRIT